MLAEACINNAKNFNLKALIYQNFTRGISPDPVES